MDDQNRNLILATVLSFLVILVWYTLFAPPPPVDTAPATQVSTTDTGAGASATGASTTATTAAAGATTPVPAGDAATSAEIATAARIPVDTPRLSGSISLLGGRLDDLLLKGYRETLDKDSPLVRLLSPVGGTEINPQRPYYAVYGWSPGSGLDPKAVPDARTLWTLEAGTTLTPETPVTLRWDNGAGLIFRRTISVDQNYMFSVAQSVENTTGAPVRLAPYGIIARHGHPTTPAFFVRHEGAVRMSDGRLEETTYKNMTEIDPIEAEGQAELVDVATDGWVGLTDIYWMTTLIPAPGQPFKSVVKYSASGELYQAEARLPVMEVAPGASGEVTTMLFAGAKEWQTIRDYQNDPGALERLFGSKVNPDRPQIKGFIDSIDWGWFFFLTKPMFMLLHWLHGLIGNMGWAIIALTFVIKTLVFPLARKSYISMARMKELQPEMEKLKEAAGDDRQKLQKGMMELYKREKVNPASGCLPILIQIPIFFSLYKVIFVTLELRHAPWFGWLRDLSAPDPSSIFNLFGLLPWAAPPHGTVLALIFIGILPIILGITMWLQQKLNPAPTDAAQAAIFAWMPWIFMFMLGGFASGLVLYWITNNLITFAQQYTIMSMHGKRPDIFGNIRSGMARKDKAAGDDKTGAAGTAAKPGAKTK